jgi:hypothetical protein
MKPQCISRSGEGIISKEDVARRLSIPVSAVEKTWIDAAQEAIGNYIQKSIGEQTLMFVVDIEPTELESWPGLIASFSYRGKKWLDIPWGPINSIKEFQIKDDNAWKTISEYKLIQIGEMSRISFDTWPKIDHTMPAIITYSAGWTRDNAPPFIRQKLIEYVHSIWDPGILFSYNGLFSYQNLSIH